MKLKFYCAVILMSFFALNTSAQKIEHYVTAKGSKLMDGDKEFRFISFNIPNLNYVEDELVFGREHAYRLPDEYEIRDAFESVKQLGGTVIRIYTIPVRRSDEPDDVPVTVLSPGKFDEEAMKVNDLMLKIANETGVRIIFSFLNNWKWFGGAPQYAEFRGKTFKEFWTDKELIEDFKKTIEYTINRTNTLTGVKYKEDKSILCWETGNELQCPHEWTVEITKYIKKLDKNHLVMDGFYAVDKIPVRKEAVEAPSIDIISSHHYELHPKEQIENIRKNIEIIDGKKPYVVGEFGFLSETAMSQTLDEIIQKDVAGALIWSLRHHRREGGFYWHSEPMGLGLYKAYHWPGFASGELYDETAVLQMMRNKAYEIRNEKAPALPAPKAPKLLPIEHVSKINWQGSVGASGYNIERSEKKDGAWELIAYNVSDAAVQYTDLFNDKTAKIGKSYYYRVTALNAYGKSAPSNVVGPIKAESKAVVDHFRNYSVMYSGKKVEIVKGDDRKFLEVVNRLAGQKGSNVEYKVPGKLVEVKVYSFEKTNKRALKFLAGKTDADYAEIKVESKAPKANEGDYGYWTPVEYTWKADKEVSFFKFDFEGKAQIARVELIYK